MTLPAVFVRRRHRPISGTSTLIGNPPTGFIYRLHRFSTIDPGGVVLSINGVTNDIIDCISAGSGTFLPPVDQNGLIMGPVQAANLNSTTTARVALCLDTIPPRTIA